MKADALDSRFSLNRFVLLARNRILDDAPAFGVSALALFAVGLLLLVVKSHAGAGGPFGQAGPWPQIIAFGGVLLAGRAFERMHDGRGGADWLLLPASSLEKYASAASVYLIVYPAAAALSAVLISAALALIAIPLGREGVGVWTPLSWTLARGFGTYLMLAAFAMAGSARFRKLPLVKTAAVVFVWMLLLSVLGMALLFAFGGGGQHAFSWRGGRFWGGGFDLNSAKSAAFQILGYLVNAAAFAFAALYGYFRVAEKEAVDEVQ